TYSKSLSRARTDTHTPTHRDTHTHIHTHTHTHTHPRGTPVATFQTLICIESGGQRKLCDFSHHRLSQGHECVYVCVSVFVCVYEQEMQGVAMDGCRRREHWVVERERLIFEK